jgi:hypothetical protein
VLQSPRKPGLLQQTAELLPLLVEYLSGNLNTPITDSLDDFIIDRDHSGRVEGVTRVLKRHNVVLSTIDPSVVVLEKQPVVYTAIKDGHT